MNILITGGAGFIGSYFARWYLKKKKANIVVLDSLTYAGNIANLKDCMEKENFHFIKGEIQDRELLDSLMSDHSFDVLVNFAAESHVDRSIIDPLSFVRTNIEGTQVLLDAARHGGIKRLVQISTDEVYGSLGTSGRFSETSPLNPTSPYAASKTAADHLVLASFKTFGFDTIITRCSNNYGPYQFPEKLIPLFITNAMNDKQLPLFGNGENVRSWLHVEDHCTALDLVIDNGRSGEVYNIGGDESFDRTNREVTSLILGSLGKPEGLISYVEDRLGHDRRYAIEAEKIERELSWKPKISFEQGVEETVGWYLGNQEWWQAVKCREHESFFERYYGERLRKAEASYAG